jgi:hypothetical protein
LQIFHSPGPAVDYRPRAFHAGRNQAPDRRYPLRTRGGWLALLLLTQIACAPDVTSPQGAAAVGQVVPMAVPDVWCPAKRAPDDSLHLNNLPACHTPADVPPSPAPQDSTTQQMIKLAPRFSGDTVRRVLAH